MPPPPLESDYLEANKPEKSGLGQTVKDFFRPKSPREQNLGARRKEKVSTSADRADPDPDLSRDHADMDPVSGHISRKEMDELTRMEREVEKERERIEKLEREEFERRKERASRDLKLLQGEKKMQVNMIEGEDREPRETRRSRPRQRSANSTDRAYSSAEEYGEACAPRSHKGEAHAIVVQPSRQHRERGDTTHHVTLEARMHGDDCDTTDEDTPVNLVRRVEKLEKSNISGTIDVPQLANVPYPSDRNVSSTFEANYRTLANVFRSFDGDKNFLRRTDEHILSYLRRVKRAIESTMIKMSDKQFISFVCRYLDKQSSDLMSESYGQIEGMSNGQFLDFLVTSVADCADQGEAYAKFWGYNPVEDPTVRNVSNMVTKLMQLMQKADYTMKEVIDKFIQMLPAEFVVKLREHKRVTPSIGLDVLLWELNKFDGQIKEYLAKNRARRPAVVGVRAVYDDSAGVDVEGLVDYTEHLDMNVVENVNFVPHQKFPLQKDDIPVNQFVAPRMQQRRYQQQYNGSQPYHGQQQRPVQQQQQQFGPQGQGQIPGYTQPQQRICEVCFVPGHTAQNCNKQIICCMCNSTAHTAPKCDVYVGLTATHDDCPHCLRMFFLRLKHTSQNCRLNRKSPFSIEKAVENPGETKGGQLNPKGE